MPRSTSSCAPISQPGTAGTKEGCLGLRSRPQAPTGELVGKREGRELVRVAHGGEAHVRHSLRTNPGGTQERLASRRLTFESP